jgi:hypothetical protein
MRHVRHDQGMASYWSYLLAGLGITGLVIARTRPRVGWWFNIAAQIAWTAYSISTRQRGFLVSGVGYTYAYVRLLRQAYGLASSPRMKLRRRGPRPSEGCPVHPAGGCCWISQPAPTAAARTTGP